MMDMSSIPKEDMCTPLMNLTKNQVKLRKYVDRNKDIIIEKVLNYMREYGEDSLSGETILYQRNPIIEEEPFIEFVRFLINIAKQQDVLLSYQQDCCLTKYACFSFEGDNYIALENYVLGQYSYQIEKKDKDINLWNNKKVIKFKEIDNLNPFSFFLIITGTSADKSVQEYSMEEKYDRFYLKKANKNTSPPSSYNFDSRNDMMDFMENNIPYIDMYKLLVDNNLIEINFTFYKQQAKNINFSPIKISSLYFYKEA